ncbi:MAG: response regulator [Defluviitaleaceae bacterium]|nr:response regulator [Defluviitaleaceae bacterium]
MISVLIVDDASIMRMTLKNILLKSFPLSEDDIYEAGDGMEAVSEYRSKKPDLVFLDITMPYLDGLGVVKGLLKVDPDAKIIMCTASNEEVDVRECLKAGAIDYIVKPPSPERVVQAMERAIGKNGVAKESKKDIKEKVDDSEFAVFKKEIASLKEELADLKQIVENLNNRPGR